MMQLDPSVAAHGVRLVALDAVDSTNTAALTQAREGERGTVWITANHQTVGRGRRGREWQSPAGNLYASVLLNEPCAAVRAPQLSFVGALALHDAVSECAPGLDARLRLKWPNDLLLDGAKLAGILVEGETLSGGRFVAVIGMGTNCASHPGDTPYPATDLAHAGFAVPPRALFRVLTRTMQERLAQWRGGADFAATRRDWLARSQWIGETILVGSPACAEGVFVGLDDEGRLMLRSLSGAVQVHSVGDIYPPGAQVAVEIPA
jgi:BirA family biotin operon repressor/biotin-[acetyl-CoA-carboxylase] ligase